MSLSEFQPIYGLPASISSPVCFSCGAKLFLSPCADCATLEASANPKDQAEWSLRNWALNFRGVLDMIRRTLYEHQEIVPASMKSSGWDVACYCEGTIGQRKSLPHIEDTESFAQELLDKVLLSVGECKQTMTTAYLPMKQVLQPGEQGSIVKEIVEVEFKTKHNNPYNHWVYKVTLVDGREFAVDLDGRQFGWWALVVPWAEYTRERFQQKRQECPFGHVFRTDKIWVDNIPEAYRISYDPLQEAHPVPQFPDDTAKQLYEIYFRYKVAQIVGDKSKEILTGCRNSP